VTITAATLRNCMLVPGGMVTPICCSIEIRLCVVNGAEVLWSPLPSRPTTSP
jgi:hypothetical protein